MRTTAAAEALIPPAGHWVPRGALARGCDPDLDYRGVAAGRRPNGGCGGSVSDGNGCGAAASKASRATGASACPVRAAAALRSAAAAARHLPLDRRRWRGGPGGRVGDTSA